MKIIIIKKKISFISSFSLSGLLTNTIKMEREEDEEETSLALLPKSIVVCCGILLLLFPPLRKHRGKGKIGGLRYNLDCFFFSFYFCLLASDKLFLRFTKWPTPFGVFLF